MPKLRTAKEVRQRDWRNPVYLFWFILSWPKHKLELRRLKRD